ncbi:MAG: hypothetical protein U0X20_21420 [Caldilineaceae bacterium]
MGSQLEWTILDIEEEEWSKVTATPGVGVALDGSAQFAMDDSPPAGAKKRIRCWLEIGGSVLLVVAVTLLLAFRLLRTAEQGLTRMRGEIEVAVKAETLHQRLFLPGHDEYATVEAIEFIDSGAMAQVVVTQTLAGGKVAIRRETRFFLQTPKGWQQSVPIAAFWGEPETLDTQHLHFEFGAADRTIATQLAPDAESFYVSLQRVAAPDRLETERPAGTRLTIELVPTYAYPGQPPAPGLIKLTSPILYRPSPDQVRSDIFAALLRQAMIQHTLDIDVPSAQPRPQWMFMSSSVLPNWLLTSDNLPLSSHARRDSRDSVMSTRSVRLDDLLQTPACAPPCPYLETPPIFVVGQFNEDECSGANPVSSWQEGATLLDFVATEYGLDAVGALVQGFARYGDWESLVPATLGISAGELENGWLGQAAVPDE